jgi:hypothetical protein
VFFGDPEARAKNRMHRVGVLRGIDASVWPILIVHQADWTRPKPAKIPGLELMETDANEAVVALDHAAFGCPPGQYRIHVDASLGESGRVLGIVDGAILFEYDGALYYLHERHAAPKTWSMVWIAPWAANPYLSNHPNAPYVPQYGSWQR